VKTTLLFCKGNGLVSNLKVGCGKRGCHGGKQRCYFAVDGRREGQSTGSIVHLCDGGILLPRPECSVKLLCYSNLCSLLGIETTIWKN